MAHLQRVALTLAPVRTDAVEPANVGASAVSGWPLRKFLNDFGATFLDCCCSISGCYRALMIFSDGRQFRPRIRQDLPTIITTATQQTLPSVLTVPLVRA